MRYLLGHIETIIATYQGEAPLAHFLKKYFRQYPKLGSRDRKQLSALAYSWYRCAKGIAVEALGNLFEQWLADKNVLSGSLAEWIDTNRTALNFDPNQLLLYEIKLSDGISKQQWLQSMLVQPDLFIRIRKDKQKILNLLSENGIRFSEISDTCLALPNSAKIDALLSPDCYVVQDASSQQTGTFLHPEKGEHWYDCCSGAGGKSLLLNDLQAAVHLTVSDKRVSILHNLAQRFKQYHHTAPTAHVLDVTDKQQLEKALGSQRFDHIICDAPCSGSGTWSRTPEQLYFFNPETVDTFSTLQTSIAINVAPYLKPGGSLFYITCSVFAKENENVVNAICKQTGLTAQQSTLINGRAQRADSMFIAVLK